MIKVCRLTLSDKNMPTFKDTYSSYVIYCAYKPRTSMRLALTVVFAHSQLQKSHMQLAPTRRVQCIIFINHSHSPELFALQ